MTGQVDMLIDGPWRLFDYRSGRGNFSVALMPSGPSGAATPLNGIDGFYVNPNTKQYKRSLDIALFMTSQASSQQFTTIAGHVPIRSDVSAGNDDLVETFAKASALGFPRPQSAEFSNYWDIFGNMFTTVLSGTVTPEVGVRTAAREMNIKNGFTYTYLPIIKH
jgi:arabinogalactan oligomer/maltooligosaccharide transport system substrate-binding protein